MRCSRLVLGFRYRKKFPYLVSTNKLPWKIAEAGSDIVHRVLAPHFAQFVVLLSRVSLPQLVLDFHPDIPAVKWGELLPGMLYVVPFVQSTLVKPEEWGPFQWSHQQVTDPVALQNYAVLEKQVGPVTSVYEFKSPDLRLLCYSIGLNDARHLTISPRSSLGTFLCQPPDPNEKQPKPKSSDFTLFYFCRPNRPPAELLRPMQKFYVHYPDLSAVAAPSEFHLGERKSSNNVKPATMPSSPAPVSYVPGLPERLAVIPGGCFGNRAINWGYWF